MSLPRLQLLVRTKPVSLSQLPRSHRSLITRSLRRSPREKLGPPASSPVSELRQDPGPSQASNDAALATLRPWARTTQLSLSQSPNPPELRPFS